MLRLQSLALTQFRNYVQRSFTFSERVVGIYGSNGTGKTNLLDAIYYLSFSRSYFSRPDSQNVHHGMAGMRLEGNYLLNGTARQLVCILRENNRKELLLNGEEYKKFSDHIGRFPCVMIAPDDLVLVTGSSEERRKFLDTLLSQINRSYLLTLIDYNKLLQQRNSLLKQAAEYGRMDEALLQVLSDQLVEKGNAVFSERKQFLSSFLQLAGNIYTRIAGSDDGISLAYESPLLHGDFAALLRENRHRDSQLQRTHTGVHRDDLVFTMNMVPFKSEASQGQRKSLLFALKLAEWQVIQEAKQFTPILLLDDVFEKLDEQRMLQLLRWVCAESDGQVFISDTHFERLDANLRHTGVHFQLIGL
ncbi:DNA replication/repair protein RecF [Sediminibacterium soli]|uniref:DNA replication/repair protein RecF n=1 Tax=Sediminibacterium soli TaxID=2698829 RepID=UPI00137B20E6|nr:DNA replication and repair protein RecF [Sediminibacterium soli]NCI46349.1 DNA replication/repair protein RecF [Sediminibacterium soli]